MLSGSKVGLGFEPDTTQTFPSCKLSSMTMSQPGRGLTPVHGDAGDSVAPGGPVRAGLGGVVGG